MGSSHKHTNPTHAQPCLLSTSSTRVVYLIQMRNLHQHTVIMQTIIYVSFTLGAIHPIVSVTRRVQLFVTPWTVAHQPPLSIRFSRQEYWSGWPLPSPGDLPDSGIKLESYALQADSLPSESPGKLYSVKLYQGKHSRELRFMGFDKCIITWIHHSSSLLCLIIPPSTLKTPGNH